MEKAINMGRQMNHRRKAITGRFELKLRPEESKRLANILAKRKMTFADFVRQAIAAAENP
jgi:hypothetical protein